MVSRGSTMINGRRKLGMQAHPHEFLADYPNKNTLEGMVGFPESGEKGLAIYAQKLIDITNADLTVGGANFTVDADGTGDFGSGVSATISADRAIFCMGDDSTGNTLQIYLLDISGYRC